jgi:signal transduction histidine kinase
VVLVLALVVTGVIMESLGRAALERLENTNRLLVLDQTAYGRLVDMQSAVRGYLLTEDRQTLAPYEPASQALPAIWTEMESLASQVDGAVSGSGGAESLSLRDIVAQVRSNAETWIRDVAEPIIELVSSGRGEQATIQGFSPTPFIQFRESANQLAENVQVRQVKAGDDLTLTRQIELSLLLVLGLLAAASGVIAIRLSRYEAKQEEEARRQAEAERRRILTVIENQPIGVWLVRRPDAAVVLQNSAAAVILPQDEWNSVPIEEHAQRFGITKPDGSPLSLKEVPVLRALREGAAVTDYELKLHNNSSGEKDLLVSAAPLLDERGRVTSAVVVMQDVTQMKRMDQRKDEFIATAAHEIRNPLAALSGYQQLMQRGVERSEVPPDLAKNVEAMGKQVDRLNNLVERLLDAQRIQLGRLVLDRSPVDIRQLVQSAIENARSASAGSHEIVAVMPQEKVVGKFDPMRLEQVLGNMINNAIRYSPEGSPIEVRVKPQTGVVRIEVVDQGPGVLPEKRARLFDRYYQSEGDTTGKLTSQTDQAPRVGKRRGLGLGLYISSEIVRAHGGRIGVEPNPEGGSIFWFTLPLQEL